MKAHEAHYFTATFAELAKILDGWKNQSKDIVSVQAIPPSVNDPKPEWIVITYG